MRSSRRRASRARPDWAARAPSCAGSCGPSRAARACTSSRPWSPRARSIACCSPPAGAPGCVGASRSRSAASRRPSPRGRSRQLLLLVAQLALEHLAGRVARQLVHEGDFAGHLVAREVLLDVGLDLVLGELLALAL